MINIWSCSNGRLYTFGETSTSKIGQQEWIIFCQLQGHILRQIQVRPSRSFGAIVNKKISVDGVYESPMF